MRVFYAYYTDARDKKIPIGMYSSFEKAKADVDTIRSDESWQIYSYEIAEWEVDTGMEKNGLISEKIYFNTVECD